MKVFDKSKEGKRALRLEKIAEERHLKWQEQNALIAKYDDELEKRFHVVVEKRNVAHAGEPAKIRWIYIHNGKESKHYASEDDAWKAGRASSYYWNFR